MRPQVVNPLADQAALEDEDFSFSIPQGSFGDPDADELAYSASLLDGSELPAWLSFDPELQRFSGTPANGDVGVIEIAVTAIDAARRGGERQFHARVVNANDAPVVAGVIADVQGAKARLSLSPCRQRSSPTRTRMIISRCPPPWPAGPRYRDGSRSTERCSAAPRVRRTLVSTSSR